DVSGCYLSAGVGDLVGLDELPHGRYLIGVGVAAVALPERFDAVAEATGQYRVKVFAVGLGGEYVLTVDGNTPAGPTGGESALVGAFDDAGSMAEGIFASAAQAASASQSATGAAAGSLAQFEPLVPSMPLATFSTNIGSIGVSLTPASYEFQVQPGQVLSAVVRPTDGRAVMGLELVGIGAATSAGPGLQAVLSASPAGFEGMCQVRVTSNRPTDFELVIYLNATLEALDSADATELDLDAARVLVGSAWYAVVADSDPIITVDEYALPLHIGLVEVSPTPLAGADAGDIRVDLIAPDGMTVLANSTDDGLGGQRIAIGAIPPGPGQYNLRITGRTHGQYVLTVVAANDAPVAVNDFEATDEDIPLVFVATALAANDTDVNGDVLTVTALTPTADTHGTVTLLGGTGTYTPDANYYGPASFNYTISDGINQATAKVTVTVSAGDSSGGGGSTGGGGKGGGKGRNK
ncbi:hypothetical protein LCGC14_2457560, partial [marine sediment metagenome]